MDQAARIACVEAAQGCRVALERCRALVDCIEPGSYTARQTDNDSIGQHVRHTLEHFGMFFEGLESGRLDYDARRREQALASDRARALERCEEYQRRLEALGEADFERPLRLRFLPAPGRAAVEIDSSVARELNFLASHAIHHLAIVIPLAREMGAPAPLEHGVAFSTAAHHAAGASGAG